MKKPRFIKSPSYVYPSWENFSPTFLSTYRYGIILWENFRRSLTRSHLLVFFFLFLIVANRKPAKSRRYAKNLKTRIVEARKFYIRPVYYIKSISRREEKKVFAFFSPLSIFLSCNDSTAQIELKIDFKLRPDFALARVLNQKLAK